MLVPNPRYELKPGGKIPRPIASQKNGIGISGIGDEGHRLFTINCRGWMPMGFAKTARKPY
ncbi:uncharacterized protein EURHEDRAFT_407380, partial [Aspergillus ruber CBS 135680]